MTLQVDRPEPYRPEELEPGVYFDLPEETYHAIPALSNSGIKNLRVSTLDFWVRSWMNPEYECEETVFMLNGKAYHKRILEGRVAFCECYAPAYDPDFAEVGELVTAVDIRGRLRDLGLKVGGGKPEMISRLLDAEPEAQIRDVLVEQHAEYHVGKTLLPTDLIRRIEIAAAMIEKHPELSKCFSGGRPEVSIVWDHEGVRMKARLDYLKAAAVVDLKTFSNPYGKPIDRAIATAMAGERYHIQAAVYDMALRAAKHLIIKGAVHGDVDPEWLKAIVSHDQTFVFVFQQTGIAPVARGKIMPRGLVYDCGRIAAEDAIATYRACLERYGTDPWIDTAEIVAFDDSEFPAYMTEV